MKVKHLIRELQKCPPEAEVWTEGCDCQGESFSVEIQKRDGSVMINREWDKGPNDEYYDNTHDTPKPLP